MQILIVLCRKVTFCEFMSEKSAENHKGDRISRCLSRISELFTTIISQNFTLKGTLTPNNVARESPFDHDGSTFPT